MLIWCHPYSKFQFFDLKKIVEKKININIGIHKLKKEHSILNKFINYSIKHSSKLISKTEKIYNYYLNFNNEKIDAFFWNQSL